MISIMWEQHSTVVDSNAAKAPATAEQTQTVQYLVARLYLGFLGRALGLTAWAIC